MNETCSDQPSAFQLQPYLLLNLIGKRLLNILHHKALWLSGRQLHKSIEYLLMKGQFFSLKTVRFIQGPPMFGSP